MTDTRELVERLRECHACNGSGVNPFSVKTWPGGIEVDNDDQPCQECTDEREAADTIESLTARLVAVEANAGRYIKVRELLCDLPDYGAAQTQRSIGRALIILHGRSGPDQIDAAIDAARSEGEKP